MNKFERMKGFIQNISSSLWECLSVGCLKIQQFRNKHIYLSLLFGPLCGLLATCIGFLCGMKMIIMIKMIGVAVFMVIWWLEGTIRMGLTGLLPMVLLPCLGIANGTKVAQIYFSDSVVVCMGSLIMASAVERYSLHHRGAKLILKYAKNGGLTAIVGCFVLITGLISMWLSNTATAALMVPLAKAALTQIKRQYPHHHHHHQQQQQQQQQHHSYSESSIQQTGIAIDLAIAFAASLGGMATLTGTGSNLVLQGVMLSLFGREGEVTFIDWFLIACPLTIVNLFVLWLVLSFIYVWRERWLCKRSSSTLSAESDSSKLAVDNKLAINSNTKTNESEEFGTEEEEEKQIEMIISPIAYSNSMDRNRLRNIVARDEEQSIVDDTRRENEMKQEHDSDEDLQKLGYPEIVVLLTFIAMGALWLTRDPPGGWGWANRFGIDEFATDGTVAIAACLVLMILPNKPPILFFRSRRSAFQVLNSEDSEHRPDQAPIFPNLSNPDQNENQLSQGSDPPSKYIPIISWTVITKLNWDIIFLLGGGFALSYGFQVSGLTEQIANLITTSGPRDLTALIIVSSCLACFCTNLMSNVAAANVLLPSLACVGPKYGYSPLMVLVPVALSISLALLFPIGTPPNAIILTSGRVTVFTLFQVGSFCTLIYLCLILFYSLYIMPILYPSVEHVSASIQSVC